MLGIVGVRLLGALITSVLSNEGPSSAIDSPAILELPDCDIFLFDFSSSADRVELANGRNITNRPGYDNQPCFTPDSQSILFSSGRQPNRTDVFEYFIESKETKQVTDSPTQEYSPQISPDNQTLSYVTDGETANQSIWFMKRGDGSDKWLLGNQGEREPVGYYSWNHETGYVLFWSRYGHSIRLVHQAKKLSHYVTGAAPPTAPHIIPGTGRFSFVHRQGNGTVWIKELDPETLAVRPLVTVVGSNNNYSWTPDRGLVMAEGTRLFRCFPDVDAGWSPIAEFDDHGIVGVTRVAVRHDGATLAVVG